MQDVMSSLLKAAAHKKEATTFLHLWSLNALAYLYIALENISNIVKGCRVNIYVPITGFYWRFGP